MPPKKAGKDSKKGKGEPTLVEPVPNPAWDVAIETGIWHAPVEELPDPNAWPTWGALRERVLGATRELTVTASDSCGDDFAAELVKLAPTNLTTLALMNCSRLTRFALSPASSCPSITSINLSECAGLEMVLIQATSLETVALTNCGQLRKVLIQAKNLKDLQLRGCPQLVQIAIWSDALTALDMADSGNLLSVDLYCPALAEENLTVPNAPLIRGSMQPTAVRALVNAQYRQKTKRAEREAERHIAILENIPPRVTKRI